MKPHALHPLLLAAALAAWTLPTPAAAWQRLGEAELRRTVAGDGSSPSLPIDNGLLQQLMRNASATTLTQEQFNAELAARGANPLPASLYDGRPVMRAALPSQPMTLTTELADVISPGGNSTLKLGTLTWTNLNAGGTVLWIWGH